MEPDSRLESRRRDLSDNSITSIEGGAFHRLLSLEDLYVANALSSIRYGFDRCLLKKIAKCSSRLSSTRICAIPMAAWVTCAAWLGVARYQVIGLRA
jgi:hypothetical protein